MQLTKIQEEFKGTTSNNAYPRFFSNHSFSAAQNFYIIPANTTETSLNSCQVASDPLHSAGDPVNASDPSGMCVVKGANGKVIMSDAALCGDDLNYWDTSCTGKYSSTCYENNGDLWIDPYKGNASINVVLHCASLGDYNVYDDAGCLGGNGKVSPPTCSSDYARSASSLGALYEKEKYAFDYFIGKGLTEDQAAGVLGNLFHESYGTMSPHELQVGYSGPGYGSGLAMWSVGGKYPSWSGVLKYAGSEGVSAYEFTLQVDFIWQEMTNPTYEIWLPGGQGSNALGRLESTTSIKSATDSFAIWFEHAGTPELYQRETSAQDIYNQFAG